MTRETDDPTDDSAKSLAKQGTIAAGALALGTGAAAGTAVAQDDEEIVVFGESYFPGVDYDVVAELEQATTTDILESATETDGQTEFDDPNDWDGYIISYDIGDTAGVLALLFTEEADLETGDSETMSEEASFRNSTLYTVEADLD